ncbi:hypothetical protein O3Q52_19985 [Streptomyces sp. ActVer]|uniref:hypothetical protein n=1 Tax=Streptomyces sp. ActVer TaxID=3014558 RepID=UPI0022B40545|nr:hypothetical protein [Streptomyces sp. ActVer]MCZ4510427.1 hypothetical protein [Streptomyces sp. ActVer]
MDFRDALNIVTAELTPQPWDYTDKAGVTLTVIPACLREAPGYAEVNIRITADKTTAAEVGVTTTYMTSLLHALEARTGWEHSTSYGSDLNVTADSDGVALVVSETDYETQGHPTATVTIRVPEAQRLPLASALRRAADVARGWEDPR